RPPIGPTDGRPRPRPRALGRRPPTRWPCVTCAAAPRPATGQAPLGVPWTRAQTRRVFYPSCYGVGPSPGGEGATAAANVAGGTGSMLAGAGTGPTASGIKGTRLVNPTSSGATSFHAGPG